MIDMPKRTVLWSRRRFVRSVGMHILAAPALLLSANRASLATSPNPMRVVLCPEDECGYWYDPSIGDPENGVAPGTAFEDLPEDWICPECGTHVRFW